MKKSLRVVNIVNLHQFINCTDDAVKQSEEQENRLSNQTEKLKQIFKYDK